MCLVYFKIRNNYLLLDNVFLFLYQKYHENNIIERLFIKLMKWPFKQVVYLIAFMVVAGCQSIDLPGVQCKQENDISSYSSTMKVSADMVETYLKAFKGVAATKVTDVTVDPVMNGSDTVMYLVNYPEGGWELLSADARLPKVLVKCDDGNVTSDQLFSSPVDGQLYVNLSDFISDIQDNPFMEISCGNDDWSDLELISYY